MKKKLNEEIGRLNELMDTPIKSDGILITEQVGSLIKSIIKKYGDDVLKSKTIKDLVTSSTLTKIEKDTIIKNSKKIIDDIKKGVKNSDFEKLIVKLTDKEVKDIIDNYMVKYISTSPNLLKIEDSLILYILKRAEKEGIKDEDEIIKMYKDFLINNKEKYKLSDDVIDAMTNHMTQNNKKFDEFVENDYKLSKVKSSTISNVIGEYLPNIYKILKSGLGSFNARDAYISSLETVEYLVKNFNVKDVSSSAEAQNLIMKLKNEMSQAQEKNLPFKKVWGEIKEVFKDYPDMIQKIETESGNDSFLSIKKFIDNIDENELKSLDLKNKTTVENIKIIKGNINQWLNFKELFTLPNLLKKYGNNIFTTIIGLAYNVVFKSKVFNVLFWENFNSLKSIVKQLSKGQIRDKGFMRNLMRTYLRLLLTKKVAIVFIALCGEYFKSFDAKFLGWGIYDFENKNALERAFEETMTEWVGPFDGESDNIVKELGLWFNPFGKGILMELIGDAIKYAKAVAFTTDETEAKRKTEELGKELKSEISEKVLTPETLKTELMGLLKINDYPDIDTEPSEIGHFLESPGQCKEIIYYSDNEEIYYYAYKYGKDGKILFQKVKNDPNIVSSFIDNCGGNKWTELPILKESQINKKNIIMENEGKKFGEDNFKHWKQTFKFQHYDDEKREYVDVKIITKMDEIIDKIDQYRKKYDEDDAFVRSVIDVFNDDKSKKIDRISFNKDLANLTESVNVKGLLEVLSIIRESKELEIWTVKHYGDGNWELVKGSYNKNELQNIGKTIRDREKEQEERKNPEQGLKKKEEYSITKLKTNETEGLGGLPTKVKEKLREKISQGWTSEEPQDFLLDFYTDSDVRSAFNDKIKIYKLKPTEDFFSSLEKNSPKIIIKKGFCRSVKLGKNEVTMTDNQKNVVNHILDKCGDKFKIF
jgi:hypothetical protein